MAPPRFSTSSSIGCPGEGVDVKVKWGVGRVLSSHRRLASALARRAAMSARVAKIAAHNARSAVTLPNATNTCSVLMASHA